MKGLSSNFNNNSPNNTNNIFNLTFHYCFVEHHFITVGKSEEVCCSGLRGARQCSLRFRTAGPLGAVHAAEVLSWAVVSVQ